MEKEIESLYDESEYSGRSIAPYKAYLRALESVFDLRIVDSFLDAGCSSGHLLFALNARHPKIELKGIDYFEWAKKHAHHAIQNFIELADLSVPYHCERQFAIVNSTEVGEHLPPESESIFIDNLTQLASDILILGWSEDKADGAHQHLNPRPQNYIRNRIIEKGFDVWPEATHQLREALHSEVRNGAYYWWPKPLVVYRRRRFLETHPKRFVQGCATDGAVADLRQSFPGLSLQKQVLALRDMIYLSVAKSDPLSILRFGDGDLYFINAVPNGSARPGFRALSIEYHLKDNLADCRKGLFQVDYVVPEIKSMTEGGLRAMLLIEALHRLVPNVERTRLWQSRSVVKIANRLLQYISKLFVFRAVRLLLYPLLSFLRYRLRLTPDKFPIVAPFQISFEAVYALVATRMIFRMFPDGIMLVGQAQKIDVIKRLVTHQAYRDYLGIDQFCGYVGVPAIGAADNEEAIVSALRIECDRVRPKVILVGIGSAKMYVIPRIKEFSNAVVIDVGAGIDALAGVVSQDRPYFADWVNFKIDQEGIKGMDLMDATNPNRDSDKYRKVLVG